MIPVLTLDGPSGVGKGTVASIIAQKLDWHLLDSGAIYRAFAIVARDNDIKIDDIDGLLKLANNFDISFKLNSNHEPLNVYLNNVEVSSELRTEKTAALASQFAKIESLRKVLLVKQRQFKKLPGLVADGWGFRRGSSDGSDLRSSGRIAGRRGTGRAGHRHRGARCR